MAPDDAAPAMISLSHLRSPDQLVNLAGRFASILLAVVVLVLVGFSLLTTSAIRDATVRAQAYGTESDAFEQAKFAMSEEESLGRKYRLQPSPAWKTAHAAAAALLVSSLNEVLAMHAPDTASVLADDSDTRVIDGVLAMHATYLNEFDRMIAAFDAGETALSDQIDVQQVDPVFAKIVNAVDAAASAHRQKTLAALADLDAIERRISATEPAVLAVGLGLVLLFGLVLRAYRRQLRRGGQRYRSLVQNASDAVAIVDADGVIGYVSPAASRVLRHDPATLVGTNALALTHPEDAAAARALLADALMAPDRPIAVGLRLAVAREEVGDFEVTAINLLGEPAVRGIVMNFRDVSEHRAFERELRHRAFHDELTGLPNRALFLDRLEQAIARTDRHATVAAVLFLDLDNFKLVNDRLGHGLGDLLMPEVAARLRTGLRKGETLARLGGDEFTVLLDELVSEDEAVGVAERVQASLREPIVIEGHEIAVTASIGVAMATQGRTTADTLLRNADLAMYQAKGDGRACYRLFDGSVAAARDRLDLADDLRLALDP